MAPPDSHGIHLCVLVHGLWGEPKHLAQVASALRQAYPDEFLQILLPKSNTGNSTYDGIELGGERVTREIEDEVKSLESEGRKVTKLSMVGYSLGGLVARYAIGILYSTGWFDRLEPVNFTTFATPHLGVRTPMLGWHNDLWNKFGGRTLSVSGQQLFTIDTFRDTGRPLLSILADPSSIFIRGLSAFKHRSLYANIVNDRAVPFYTAFMSPIDPFTNLDVVDIHYVDGYEDVIIDAEKLASPRSKALTVQEWVASSTSNILAKAPLYILFGVVLLPFGSLVYLVNSGIQSYRSAQRIRLHEEGKAGIGIGAYRLPLLIENVQHRAERTFESVNARQEEEYLPEPSKDVDSSSTSSRESTFAEKGQGDSRDVESQNSDFPTLALTPEQFAMIESLDKVGFKKHAVHIHKAPHSHAAIIVRTQKQTFTEGKIVAKHWTERFEI